MNQASEIKVEIVDGKGAFIKPYPNKVLNLIFELSGRKKWTNHATFFEATPSNLRILEKVDNVIFIEDGELTEQKKLENLPSQQDEIEELKTDYVPKLPWKDIQKATLKQSADRRVFAHLHDPGAGKTAIMIAEFGMLFLKGEITGVLISSPNKVDYQWINEQIPTHLSDQVKYKAEVWDKKPLDKTWGPKSRFKNLQILAMNVDSFRTPKGKNVAEDFIKRHKGKIMMIVDESHQIMNWSSQRTKAICKIGENCKYKRIATGTLIGKSLLDAWAQFKFLDWKILGHKYQTSFKSEFSVMGGFEMRQIIADKNTDRFWSLIAPHSYRASESEIRGGEITSQVKMHKYKMDAKTKKAYKKLKETSLAEIDNKVITTAKNGLSAILRLQQLLNGYLPDDETSEIIHFSNQRVKELYKIVKTIDTQVIIWAAYIPDFKAINEFLTDKGYRVGVYRGTKKHCAAVKKKFKDGEIDIMIANPASGGTGENFQGACLHDIYYSYNYNQFDHWQSLKRIDRQGAHGKVTHHFLACAGSTNMSILSNINRKTKRKRISLDDVRNIIDFSEEVETPKTKKKPTKKKVVSKKQRELLMI